MDRFATTLEDGHGVTRAVIVAKDGEGVWRAICHLPGHGVLDGSSVKRRDAVATVERKLIRATGGGRLVGQYRTCAFTEEAGNVVQLRPR